MPKGAPQAERAPSQQAGGEASLTPNEGSGTAFIPSPPDILAGGEEGDNSPPGEQHDSRDTDFVGTTPLGTGKEGADQDGGDLHEADTPLRTSVIIERFRDQTRARLRPETQQEYAVAFRRFAVGAGLESFTRRQLAGPKGRMLVLAHLEHVPRPSWRCHIAMLKAVWSFGLNLPWPIDARRDLGKFPRTRRRESPSDAVMAAWKEAISHEPNLCLQLEWLLIAQHGWRPSHVTRLRWRNVRCNEVGKPSAVIADGSLEGFKTSSPIAARLAPDIMEALDAWRKATSEPLPDRPIFPGRRDSSRGQDPITITKHWRRLQKRWRLPILRPVDVRHWVAGACRRADLSKQASAYLMGHDPTQGGSMRDWYDNPQIEDVLTEQAEKMPYGPLGMLGHGAIELIEGLPSDAVPLMLEYLAGQIGTMEFATRAEVIRLRGSVRQAPRPER